ncbi:MAG: response regulator transcription factor [Acidimicrobiales bacterium]
MGERAPAKQVRSGSLDEASVTRSVRPERVPMSAVIVDDHRLAGEGTIQLLEQAADTEVVGQAGSGEEGLGLLERLHPDAALVDVNLSGTSWLDVNGTPMLDKTLSSRLARRGTGPTGREALTSRGEAVVGALSRHLVARESHGTPGLPR